MIVILFSAVESKKLFETHLQQLEEAHEKSVSSLSGNGHIIGIHEQCIAVCMFACGHVILPLTNRSEADQ